MTNQEKSAAIAAVAANTKQAAEEAMQMPIVGHVIAYGILAQGKAQMDVIFTAERTEPNREAGQ